MGKLLRKPRAPKPLPPLPVTPEHKTGKDKFTDYFESYDFGFDDEIAQVRDATLRQSPTPSVVPSLVSPPPPSESNARRSFGRTVTYQSPTLHSRVSFISREEKKFVLDPLFRDHTSLGTYVDGKSLVKPYKPRGPDGLPARAPKKYPEIMHAIDIVDDIRFYSPPAFTLENFMVHLSEIRGLPLRKVKEAMYSKHNYKKMTKLLAEKTIYPQTQENIHLHHLTPEGNNRILYHIYPKYLDKFTIHLPSTATSCLQWTLLLLTYSNYLLDCHAVRNKIRYISFNSKKQPSFFFSW